MLGGHDQFNRPLLAGKADSHFRTAAGLRPTLLAPVNPKDLEARGADDAHGGP